MALYKTQLQLIRRSSKNNISMSLVDNSKISNINNDFYFISKKYSIFTIASFSNDIASKFIQSLASITSSKFIFNIDQLYDSATINLTTKSGFILLYLLKITDSPQTTDILSYNMDINAMRLYYNMFYDLYINKDKFTRKVTLGVDTFIDNLLLNNLNMHYSNSDMLNTFFFYRTFPIFNYAMYILNNRYYDKHILYDQPDIKFDFDFTNINNINILDMTFLNYIHNDNIEIYMLNINHLLNINYNILDYLFSYKIYFDEEETNVLLTSIYNPAFAITSRGTATYIDACAYIILKEIGIIAGILDSEVYFKFSEMLSKKKLPRQYDIRIKVENRLKEEIISNYGLLCLLTRGLIRIFTEISNVLLCIKSSDENDPIHDMRHISNFDRIPDEDMRNKIFENLHYGNLDIISKYYNRGNIADYDILSIINFVDGSIHDIINKFAIEQSKPVIKQIFIHFDIIKAILSIITKFINTLKYISLIISNDNYKLLLFLLFSNNNTKLIVEPQDNVLVNNLIQLYKSKYDIYVSGIKK
ncbi:hypothetical protein [Alphaentomopoxvirus acuprea]|uniref:Uncharacterized protein n=1 Tax=Alphaentomopoxvirus acuprea TaxID=62099 RepID=W6JL11_9POXV|nr:hypothetical protein BA82_gp145 [Anomala cuprea entomopoxvirus]BAO49505.1 hypothetical protein [Anomala cuprea entomopoxvirus]